MLKIKTLRNAKFKKSKPKMQKCKIGISIDRSKSIAKKGFLKKTKVISDAKQKVKFVNCKIGISIDRSKSIAKKGFLKKTKVISYTKSKVNFQLLKKTKMKRGA